MWYAMIFLYPELWEKFKIEIPSYEDLADLGFPKDKTSGIFMEWLDAWVDYCQSNGTEKLELHDEIKRWRTMFKESIEDEYKKTICSKIVYASWP